MTFLGLLLDLRTCRCGLLQLLLILIGLCEESSRIFQRFSHIIIFLDCSTTPITRFAVDKEIAPLSEAEIPVMDKIFEFKGKSIIAQLPERRCSFGYAENGSIFVRIFNSFS